MKHTLRIAVILVLMALPTSALQPVLAQAGRSEAAHVEQGESPAGFVLSAAYPNPFNPRTSFSLTVRERQEVTVQVYNLLGTPVRNLFTGVIDGGETRTFVFEAGDLPSGIYLYRVQGESFSATRQVTLLK